jgi:hypothetical protein
MFVDQGDWQPFVRTFQPANEVREKAVDKDGMIRLGRGQGKRRDVQRLFDSSHSYSLLAKHSLPHFAWDRAIREPPFSLM